MAKTQHKGAQNISKIDTMMRRICMLQLVPKPPKSKTARQITEALHAQNFNVSKRTVERDLEKLSGVLPIYRDTRGTQEYHWRWQSDAPRYDIPAMPITTALSFLMVEKFCQKLLPPALQAQLSDYLEAAHIALKSHDVNRLEAADWPNKVRVVPTGQPLLAPILADGVLDTIYEALLHNRRFQAQYRPRSEQGKPREYLVNPLALVVRNHLMYLIATLWDYDDIKHLPLHRFSEVTVLEQDRRVPEGFDLDRYLYQSRAFDIPDPEGQTVSLVARFTEGAAYHLYESPLSNDQVIEPDSEGWVTLTATVLNTEQLWWWLNGFGDQIEVIHPKS